MRSSIITDLFQAYYRARRNKRNTINQLKFELNFEHEIFKLYNEIENRSYRPLPETAFIINKPVQREIFAANFRDRVIHHLLFQYISPIIEKYLIYDCYSCRKGKGTSAGIKRAAKFLRACSQNYKKDCWIMQMDISGYFMGINRELLYHKVNGILQREYQKRALSADCATISALSLPGLTGQSRGIDFKDFLDSPLSRRMTKKAVVAQSAGKGISFDKDIVDFLLKKTIFRNPADNCKVKGPGSGWTGLPANKSLFYTSPGCGLPIGNLTSQLFGNVFLNDFDHWMKKIMDFGYYGRYVDDFFIMHPDKGYLLGALPKIADYLKMNEKLTLHPNKTKIKHYKTGFLFLGAVIKPYRNYIGNRTKGNFYQAVKKQNRIINNCVPTDEEKKRFISSMNSYLGIMKHYKTYKIRKCMLENRLSPEWWNSVFSRKAVKNL
ncbi:MAG: RNA-directed DNA polymerase, partial [Candidatus Omnitrophota bacterium]